MGDKARARAEMKRLGLPVLPGSSDSVSNESEALAVAEEIGYPVIVKAAAGGGGRGMRVAASRGELSTALHTAQTEAAAAFGSPHCYIERFIAKARHIEFQILADEHGHAIHLGERECSIQRRHQKLIEESPSPMMTPELRAKIGASVVKAVLDAGYTNAGTLEFLVDEENRFYFMEMNTRIQVEHPVTEMVTGIDLVRDQILIAAGMELPHKQEEIQFRGHAIECRLNAEDPITHRPSPGRIHAWHAPGGPGIRVDTAAYTEYVIPPHYDSLIAKLVAHGCSREEALNRMERALEMFIVEGVQTTIPLHREILRHPDFRRGAIYTRFIDQLREERARIAAEPA
jgi:acetyl-CoA carboxylase biotin carboxylase subunit